MRSQRMKKKSKMSTYVPIEIQLEIMKRFPIKPLLQFRSVCKQWKSVIDSSEFISNYNDLLRNTESHKHHLLVKYTDQDEVGYKTPCFVSMVDDDDDDGIFPQHKLSLTFPTAVKQLDFEGTVTVGSSQGLVCLYDFLKTHAVVIWNPTINKSVAISVPNLLGYSYDAVIGFWVCPRTNDPKLVKINFIRGRSKRDTTSFIPYQVEVFSLSSRVWRCSSRNLPRKSVCFRNNEYAGPQVFIDGFIYWLGFDRVLRQDDVDNTRSYPLITSFDVITEEFKHINLPDSFIFETGASMYFISMLNGSLVILEHYYKYDPYFNIWIMMKHGDPESFTKLFSIKEPTHIPMPVVKQVCLFRNSGEIIFTLADKNRDYYDSLFVYEPWSQNVRYIGITAKACTFRACSYTESLLLLDHTDIPFDIN